MPSPEASGPLAGSRKQQGTSLIGESARAGVFFVSDCQPYKSDLSDERWALIDPVIASWKAQHPSVSGHQGAYAMRGGHQRAALPVPYRLPVGLPSPAGAALVQVSIRRNGVRTRFL